MVDLEPIVVESIQGCYRKSRTFTRLVEKYIVSRKLFKVISHYRIN